MNKETRTPRISRRRFLHGSMSLAGAGLLAACGAPTQAPTSAPAPTEAAPTEAPAAPTEAPAATPVPQATPAPAALMGGYVYPPRAGFPPWGVDMDYNIQVDVQSARYVIEHSNPTLVPLSVTVETSLRRAYLGTLRNSGALGQLLARQAEAFARDENNEERYGKTCSNLPNDIINFQHDPLACAIALGWDEGVEITEIPLKLDIRNGWLHEIIDTPGKPTKVVTRIDGNRFNEFWIATVSSVSGARIAN